MTRLDLRLVQPDPMSIWECPCGFRSEYKRVISHRKGYRNRPACAAGKIRPYDASTEPEPIASPLPPAYDFAPPQAAEIDPEEIARQLRQQRERPALPPPGEPGEPALLAETPPQDVRATISTITIRLAARHLVMYDYFKGQNWFVDDGSVSAWVEDMLNTLFLHVLGISVAVVPLSEVKIDG